jgi:hypothetical protein
MRTQSAKPFPPPGMVMVRRSGLNAPDIEDVAGGFSAKASSSSARLAGRLKRSFQSAVPVIQSGMVAGDQVGQHTRPASWKVSQASSAPAVECGERPGLFSMWASKASKPVTCRM